MEQYSVADLPLELIMEILQHMTHSSIINLCVTSKKYSSLVIDELWYSMVYRILKKPVMYKYNTIQEYNKINYTKYNNWLQLYLAITLSTQHISKYSLLHAVNVGHLELVRILLSHPKVNINITYCKLMEYTAMPILKGKSSSCLLILACVKGYVNILKILLDDERFNPSESHNLALRKACEGGHIHCIEVLLKDTRVDPSACHNDALISACECGQYEVVSILLKESRVNPCDLDNAAIGTAIIRNDVNMVKLLLNDDRVNPRDRNNYFIIKAQQYGYSDMMKLLI